MNPPEEGRSVGRPAPLVILLLASTLTIMAGAVVAPVLEVIRSDLGVGGTAAGLIITTHGLATALASPLAGWLIDRWGVRVPLAGGLVLYGVAGGAGMVTDSYAALIASRFVFGLGAAAVFTGTTVALLAYYRGTARDKVMGWRSTAISLGGVAWPLLAGALGEFSWHTPFAIYTLGIPLGLATLLVLPRAAAAGTDQDEKGGGILPLLRRRPAILGYYTMLIVASLLLYSLAVFAPIRLGEVGVRAPFIVALISMANSVAMTLVGLAYAKARAGLGYRRLLQLVALLWVTAFAIMSTTGSPVLIAVAMGLFGLGMGLQMPAVTVLIGDSAPPDLRGQATALSGTASFAGQFVSPLLLGPLVDTTSVRTGYLAATGIALVLLVVLLVVRLNDPGETAGEQDTPKDPAVPAAGTTKEA